MAPGGPLPDLIELSDDVEPHVRELVLEESQEHGHKVLDGGVLAERGSELHHDAGEGRPDVLRGVGGELPDAREHQGDHLHEIRRGKG